MQRSDERNGPTLDIVENPMPHTGMGDALDRRSLEMLGQIETGREMIAMRRTTNADARLAAGPLHSLTQLGNHRIADGIALGRAVQPDQSDRSFQRIGQLRERHYITLAHMQLGLICVLTTPADLRRARGGNRMLSSITF